MSVCVCVLGRGLQGMRGQRLIWDSVEEKEGTAKKKKKEKQTNKKKHLIQAESLHC